MWARIAPGYSQFGRRLDWMKEKFRRRGEACEFLVSLFLELLFFTKRFRTLFWPLVSLVHCWSILLCEIHCYLLYVSRQFSVIGIAKLTVAYSQTSQVEACKKELVVVRYTQPLIPWAQLNYYPMKNYSNIDSSLWVHMGSESCPIRRDATRCVGSLKNAKYLSE